MLSGMQQEQKLPRAPAPLPDDEFTALRLWAVGFGMVRRVGVAIWPFSYTRAQEARLRAMAEVIPQWMRIIWITIFVVIWFGLGCLILFLMMIPLSLALIRHPGAVGGLPLLLLMIGIIADMISAYVLGNIVASFVTGRLLNAVMAIPAPNWAADDGDLLVTIRRQVARIGKFGAFGAALALLAPILAIFV